MTISTMKSNKFNKLFKGILIFAFWVAVWFLFALIINDSTLLPSPYETAKALFDLLRLSSFYSAIFFSFLRVTAGLISGITIGTVLAFLSHKFTLLRSILSPIISIMKAMPVATFILILWITLRGWVLTVFIGFIMVMPIIFQNVLSGLDSIDKELVEVAKIFEFSKIKKLRLLIFPSVFPFLFPAIITSIGLAFKSQIAAEVIAYTNKSIGQYIYDATYGLNTDVVFAWATVIIVFSIGLESLCKYLIGRVKNEA